MFGAFHKNVHYFQGYATEWFALLGVFDRLVCVFQGGAVSPSHAQPPAVGTSGQGKNLLSFLLPSHRHTSLACVSWCCVGDKTEIKASAF